MRLAYLLVLFSLGAFIAGCGTKDEKSEGKKASETNADAGDGVKVEEGNTKEVNPNDIQFGTPGGDVELPTVDESANDQPQPPTDGSDGDLEGALPSLDPPQVDSPAIESSTETP